MLCGCRGEPDNARVQHPRCRNVVDGVASQPLLAFNTHGTMVPHCTSCRFHCLCWLMLRQASHHLCSTPAVPQCVRVLPAAAAIAAAVDIELYAQGRSVLYLVCCCNMPLFTAILLTYRGHGVVLGNAESDNKHNALQRSCLVAVTLASHAVTRVPTPCMLWCTGRIIIFVIRMLSTKFWKIYDILCIVLLQFFFIEKDGKIQKICIWNILTSCYNQDIML